jgi:hypothetical protein
MFDSHADRRDAQRRKARFGHTTTNPGLRHVQRALAARHQEPRSWVERAQAGVLPAKILS